MFRKTENKTHEWTLFLSAELWPTIFFSHTKNKLRSNFIPYLGRRILRFTTQHAIYKTSHEQFFTQEVHGKYKCNGNCVFTFCQDPNDARIFMLIRNAPAALHAPLFFKKKKKVQANGQSIPYFQLQGFIISCGSTFIMEHLEWNQLPCPFKAEVSHPTSGWELANMLYVLESILVNHTQEKPTTTALQGISATLVCAKFFCKIQACIKSIFQVCQKETANEKLAF